MLADGTLEPGDPGYVDPEATQDTTDPGFTPSDQSETLAAANAGVSDTNATATTALQGVPLPDKQEYVPPNASTLIGNSGLKAGSIYISPESTVSGQLEGLLNSNSQYMQTADRRAKEQAASLGLLGSSMAVGASERAARETALPVAQQDAKTYATAQLAEQSAANAMSQLKVESDLSAAAREHTYNLDTAKASFTSQLDVIASNAKASANYELEGALNKMQVQWDTEAQNTLAKLDAELTLLVNEQELSSQERVNATNVSSQIMAAAYGTVNDLMGNADFMAGYANNAAGLTTVFNNFINIAKDQVAFIGASAGLAAEYTDLETGYIKLIGSWE